MYQIIVASYQDSTDDGWGDLNGIKQRLDYIQQLGSSDVQIPSRNDFLC